MELRAAALQALQLCEPQAKVAAVGALQARGYAPDPAAMPTPSADLPGRPLRPHLVAAAKVPVRGITTATGHAALLHAIAHIEFNAINLALDAVWRFADLPEAYYRDWVKVAGEEATHFELLCARLRAMGRDYGDFDAHDGLWQMAEKTADDVLARMALVPRTLEARGLDASPAVRAKLLVAGDEASAAVIDTILRDEIGHVAIGNHWFRHLCREHECDPYQAYEELARRYGAPRLRGPFNLDARRAAGFDESELRSLGT
jgi:uncharacterized ferritin-like protein (DUF455 family)